MKRLFSIILATLVALSCLALASCNKKENPTGDATPEATLSLGLGITSSYGKATNADGETNGSAAVDTTAAAVLLDAENKIVKCVIDSVDGKVEYSEKGELVAVAEYKTKGELGKDYGMSAIGKTEWNEQVAALCKLAEGKTIDQVKAWLVDGGKGNDEVINAGCTITISDFVTAIEKAVKNAAASNATAKDTLSLAFVTKQDKVANATSDKSGSCEVVANICAAVVAADGKTVAMKTDSVGGKVTFTTAGVAETDTTAAIATKRELGKDYNMAAYGQDLNEDGVVKEWFEQADVFDAACIGKNADEIAALAVNGYGVESVQTAGCTIAISDMVATAIKAIK